jgi:Nucleotidyl transferase AbiEii toxin, Type IV TA system
MGSGSEVVLQGPVMVNLIRVVDSLSDAGLDRYVIVGGLAVAARLGQAHRATTDVDAVIDEAAHPDAIEALLALPNAREDLTGRHRLRVAGTKVEIIGVEPLDERAFEGLTDQQTLFTDAPTVWATGAFATPAALFAMKLHAIQDRSASRPEKRSSDALDLYRLLLELDADGSIRAALASAPDSLRVAVRSAIQEVLIDRASKTKVWLSASDDPFGPVSADELRYLAQPVVDALGSAGSS